MSKSAREDFSEDPEQDEYVADRKTNNITSLVLSEEIKRKQIVASFVFERKSNHLVLLLNHKSSTKTIVSPVFEKNWPKTTETFTKQLLLKGVSKQETNQLCDIVDNNFENILGLNENANDDWSDDKQAKQKEYIAKYTGNGTLPLHESIVIVGQPSIFLSMAEHEPQYLSQIQTANKILCPRDTIDTQNPLPYIFRSAAELDAYVGLARKETFETLHSKVESIFKKYVNTEEHYSIILAADIIYSYFQDKFGTTHYNIFIGDNGSGKNSALLVFKYLGYRVFYVTAASAPNYFTFLGNIEEGQGTTAEDEAEDIGYDKDKQKIFRTGYCAGATVPKVDLSFRRTQDAYLTYCHKWLAMEALPDYRKIKGVLDRSFVYNFVVGDVQFNIKEIIQQAGDPKLKRLYDELIHMRKLLFAFRMIRYSDVIPDIDLNIIHRNAELTKPLLRLFNYRNDSSKALERIRIALSKFIMKRNELKRNSIEAKLREAINNLITKHDENPEQYEGLPQYGFYNDQIWSEVKNVMEGIDILGKSASFYSVEYGTVSNKFTTGLYKSKFKADSFRSGSGGDTKRGLKFSNDVLDRLGTYYDVPDEIKIRSTTDKTNTDRRDTTDGGRASRWSEDTVEGATYATDATDYEEKRGVSKSIPDGMTANNNENNSTVFTFSSEAYTKSRVDDYANRQNNASETSLPLSTSVASVAPVAEIKNNNNNKETAKARDKSKEVGLPAIPCLFCDYKDPIEFDLSVHYQEKHVPELVKLPIGKSTMAERGAYAVHLSIQEVMDRFERMERDEDDGEEDE